MIRDITIGQYFPGESFLHKMDPRAKILLMVVYVVALFLAKSVASYLLIGLTTVGLMALSRISPKFYLKGLRPLLFVMAFTAVLNMLYSSGDPIVSFWIFSISAQGIVRSVTMVFRIILMVVITSVLTYTTSPLLLTGGLERLLSPLNRIRIPVHDFAMMMNIALRFIPTLLDETEKIMNAQKARGADFESGGLIRRAKALVPILIPLFVSAFRRAEELAVAMECRCYDGSDSKRTRFIEYSFTYRDAIAAVACAALIAATSVLNRLLPFGGIL